MRSLHCDSGPPESSLRQRLTLARSGVPRRLTIRHRPQPAKRSDTASNGAVLELGTSSHQPSASSPGRWGHGLDERAQTAPTRSVWCSPAGWPHSKPPPSQAYCIAISSFVLAAGTVGGDGQAADRRLRGLQLDPGRTEWSPGHGSGVPPSAQRHPPGEGAAAPACQPPSPRRVVALLLG
jgi:hypothetical protein